MRVLIAGVLPMVLGALACGRGDDRAPRADSTAGATAAAAPVAPALPAAREFRLYATNGSVAPPHQWRRVLRGRLSADRCEVLDSLTDSSGTRARTLALTGADHAGCVTLLRDTRVEGLRVTEMPIVGAGVLNVTLADSAGRTTTGVPSNGDAWRAFVERVAARP